MKAGTDSLAGRIVRASVAVGIAHIVFKLLGLVQAIIVGRELDNSTYDTVFAFAFEGCIWTVFLIGEESIGPALLPVFMRELNAGGEKSAWRFANTVLTVHAIVVVLVAALIMLFPDTVLHLLTYWNRAGDAAKSELARQSLVWLAPSLICFSVGSTTYMLLNGYKRFFLAALADAAWKFFVLLFVLVGMVIMGMDFRAVILGVLVGSVAKLVTHLIGLRDKLPYMRPSLDFSHPALRTMLLLMAPLILGILFAKVRDFYNNVTILTYLETDGLLKANSFGRKLYVAFGTLVPYAISIAIFPFLCDLVDRKDSPQFARLLTASGRMLLSIFVPLSMTCAILAEPISFFVLHGGRYGADTVALTAVSMACYTLVLPGLALENLLMQAFFAQRRMWSVTLAGVFFSALSIAASYIGIVHFRATGAAALAIVALGATVARTLKAGCLIGLLRQSAPVFPPLETVVFLARVLIAGLVTAIAARAGASWCAGLIGGGHAKLPLLIELGVAGLCALAAFLASIRLLRIHEPREMLFWCIAKLRQRRAKPSPLPRPGGEGLG